MSNNATKKFFIIFGIIVVVGIVLFAIANKNSKNTPEKTPEPDTSNIEVLGPDIWGNEYVRINGEKSILIE